MLPPIQNLRESFQHLLHKKEVLLFVVAFGVRFAVFIFLLWWFRVTGHMPDVASAYPVISGDSASYADLANNLFQYGIFSSSGPVPPVPESFRLPGYPFFLYLFEFLPYPHIFATLVQMAAASGSVVLVYLFGKKFFSEKTGFIGALLLCIDPMSVFMSVLIMSDTLFVFAMLLGIYVLFRRTLTVREALFTGLLAGMIFGYAVLVRVIAQYLAVCMLAAYVLVFHKELRPFSSTLLKLGAFIIGVILVMAPWSIRNYKQFGTFTLSSTPYINFTQYNLVYFYAYREHTTTQEVQHLFSDPVPYPMSSPWFFSLVNESVFLKEMRDGLRGKLIPYAKFHLVKTLPFFLNDSFRDINRVTGLLPQDPRSINFSDLLLRKEFGQIARYFATSDPSMWLLVVGATFWMGITLLWVGGLFSALMKRTPKIWFILFASGIIVYFAILSSPVIQPRYRIPAAPFMFLLAAESAVGLWGYYKKKKVRVTG